MISKSQIINSFSRAAATYDTYADVQVETARRLISRLEGSKANSVLEIGCGTGNYTLLLERIFDRALITAVDISPAMIRMTGEKLGSSSRAVLTVADGESLPPDLVRPYDLITSNGAFHWFPDFRKTMLSYGQILSERGMLVYSIFGPRTLSELDQSLAVVIGPSVRLPAREFPSRDASEEVLSRLFHHAESEELLLRRTYPDLLSLLRRLKGTGVAPRSGAAPLRLTPALLAELERAYLDLFGEIRATYQVFLCEGRCRKW